MSQTWRVFDNTLIEERSGFVSILLEGNKAKQLFEKEAGGHRFQRISPTEKRGRVHTSTVTVAVLDPFKHGQIKLDEADLDIKASRGSGPGGQHRNKVESCITITHRPTGLSARVDMKSQHQSKEMALGILSARLDEQSKQAQHDNHNEIRRNQVGQGQRGDKIRTYRTQDDRVTDHRTGCTQSLKKWMKGEWTL